MLRVFMSRVWLFFGLLLACFWLDLGLLLACVLLVSGLLLACFWLVLGCFFALGLLWACFGLVFGLPLLYIKNTGNFRDPAYTMTTIKAHLIPYHAT